MVSTESKSASCSQNTGTQNKVGKGLTRSAAHARSGYKKNRRGRLVPVEGPVIGYIYQHEFWSLDDATSAKDGVAERAPQALWSYGAAALIHEVQKDIADALLKVYAIENYETIMAMVALRVIRPSLALNNYQTQYLSSWVSKFWPYAKVSPKVVKKFVTHLGMRPDCFQMVFADLLNKATAASHHIMIDGFVLPGSSSSDPIELALFQHDLTSHTNRVVMYVSDVESKDLLGAVTFLQEDVNASAYKFFVSTRKVSQGVIVADKDFAVQELKPLLEANPDLHYLAPVARDSEVAGGQGFFRPREAVWHPCVCLGQ